MVSTDGAIVEADLLRELAFDCQARDVARRGRHQANVCVFPQFAPSVSLGLEQSALGAFWTDLAINPDTELQGAHVTAPRTVAMAASLSRLAGQTLLHDAPRAFAPELRSCVFVPDSDSDNAP
jgi:hypothetical protein